MSRRAKDIARACDNALVQKLIVHNLAVFAGIEPHEVSMRWRVGTSKRVQLRIKLRLSRLVHRYGLRNVIRILQSGDGSSLRHQVYIEGLSCAVKPSRNLRAHYTVADANPGQ